MRVTVLHVLCPTGDIDISLVTVGQRAVEFTLLDPPLLGCWGISAVLSIPLVTIPSVPLVTVLSFHLVSTSLSLLAEVCTEGE